MNVADALKTAIYYHLLALPPTLLGAALSLASLWVALIEPTLSFLNNHSGADPLNLATNLNMVTGLSPLLALGGSLAGYLVYRIGRTTLLFKLADTDPITDLADN